MLLAYSPAGTKSTTLTDNRLTDPQEIWKSTLHQRRRERAPLWIAALILSTALIAWAAHHRRRDWECVLAAGPLLFCLQAMTSYDYMWLLLLVPLAMPRRSRLVALLGYAVFTSVAGVFQEDVEARHILYGWGLLALLVWFYADLVRETSQRSSTKTATDTVAGDG